MFRGGRIRHHPYFALLPLVGLLLFSFYGDSEQTDYTSSRSEQAPSVSIDETASSATEPESSSKGGRSPSLGAIYGDTLAQWVMAVGTIATVALVTWTLCVTRGMLREARLATKAAIRAANSANSANSTVLVTRRIGEAQVRAYVEIDKIWLDTTDGDAIGGADLWVSCHNSGQSRAVGPVVTYSLSALGKEATTTGVIAFPAIEAGRTRKDYDFIGFRSFHEMKSSERIRIDDARDSCILKVVISYADVFGSPDRTSSGALIFFAWDDEHFTHTMKPIHELGLLTEAAFAEHDQIVADWRERRDQTAQEAGG